jgi:hypothetical protein
MAEANQPGKVLPFVGLLIAPRVGAEGLFRRVSTDVVEIESVTGPFPFHYTDYYEPEMGRGLVRYWALGTQLCEPDELAEFKLKSNGVEAEFTVKGRRRVNVDPGYISDYAVVAATCKALPAAVYVTRGVYGYPLFLYRTGTFVPFDWTYPDYLDYVEFFNAGRRRMFNLKKSAVRGRF